MDMNFGDVFAVVDGGENFLCESCAIKEKVELDSEHVPTWEVGSRGWLAPVVCKKCRRSIPVIVDGVGSPAPKRPCMEPEMLKDMREEMNEYFLAGMLLMREVARVQARTYAGTYIKIGIKELAPYVDVGLMKLSPQALAIYAEAVDKKLKEVEDG